MCEQRSCYQSRHVLVPAVIIGCHFEDTLITLFLDRVFLALESCIIYNTLWPFSKYGHDDNLSSF